MPNRKGEPYLMEEDSWGVLSATGYASLLPGTEQTPTLAVGLPGAVRQHYRLRVGSTVTVEAKGRRVRAVLADTAPGPGQRVALSAVLLEALGVAAGECVWFSVHPRQAATVR